MERLPTGTAGDNWARKHSKDADASPHETQA